MMKVMNKLALVLAVALCIQSVSAVHTEQRKVVLNQKLEGDWKWEVTFDILEGVVQGFFEYEKYPNLKQCASDLYEVYDDVDHAIQLIEKKTAKSVAAGVALIGQSFTELSTAIGDCKGAAEDVENIISALEQFTTPASFAYHIGKDLLINGVDIYHEINTAVADWKAQSYRDCGLQVGTALNQLLIGQDMK